MAKRDKRLEKARRNPKGFSFDELCQLYKDHGFTVRQAKGSHAVAFVPGNPISPRTFPRSNPMKAVYVREAIDAIEELQTLEEEESTYVGVLR